MRTRAAVTLAAAVALAAMLSAGCDDDDDQPTAPASRPPAGPEVTDAERQRIRDTYEQFVVAAADAAVLADPHHPPLLRTADGPALLGVQQQIAQHTGMGHRYDGQVRVLRSRVTGADPQALPPMPAVTVAACLDLSGYQLVTSQTGAPVTGRPGSRPHATAVAKLWYVPERGRWMVLTHESNMEESC